MTVIVPFNTRMFDVSRERPNPINPIAGESLLRWLGEKLPSGQGLSEPNVEDWGWYSSIEWDGSHYMLGSSASEAEDGVREWVLQVLRNRSLKERLLGRGRVTPDAPLVIRIVGLLSGEPQFMDLQVERAA